MRERLCFVAMAAHTLLSSELAESLTLAAHMQTASAGIVSRTLLQTEELRVVLFTFAAGQELTTHSSKRRALVQVLSGACDFFFAEKWHRLTAGDFLHMPPGQVHAVKAPEEFSMLLTLGADAKGGE